MKNNFQCVLSIITQLYIQNMRNSIILLIFTILQVVFLNAQSPSLMSYQAVIWDVAGNLVVEKEVNIRLSILQGTATGQAVYVETHRPRTNANGLVSLLIGGGTNVSGKIADIQWGAGNYFLKTETDPSGGTNYSITGTTQLVSVPYAMYAYAAAIADRAGNIITSGPGLPGQVLTLGQGRQLTWISTPPILSTNAITDINPNSATSGGNITSDGGEPVTSRGLVWSTSPSPTISLPTKTNSGTGIGSFTSIISGLSSNVVYYVRAYATNRVGTSYGNEVIFTTKANVPILTTASVNSITTSSAVSGGTITSDGGTAILARGVVWSTSPNPSVSLSTKTLDGVDTGSFVSNISNLASNVTYYVRAYATNSAGTGYGNQLEFKTEIGAVPPTVTTISASSVAYTAFTSGGNVTFNGGANVTARGVVWSQTQIPTITLTTKSVNGNGNGTFASFLFDLTPNTTYYVRAYATNSAGTGYGKVDTVKTRAWVDCPSTVTDIDGNVYNVVTIGYQCWTKENMKVSRYRNGDVIPVIINNYVWGSLTSGIRCWYANDSIKFEEPFGNLYNWYAASDNRGMCPSGWHVPTDVEWNELTDYLGGQNYAEKKMKDPNGFSALPGGYRHTRGDFAAVWEHSYFWSSSDSGNSGTWNSILNPPYLSYGYRFEFSYLFGASVRCLRD